MKNPTNQDIAKLIHILREAGWIERSSIDGDAGNILFTVKGLDRMNMLSAVLPAFMKITRGGKSPTDINTLLELGPDFIKTIRGLNIPASFAPMLAGFVRSWKRDTNP